MEENTPIKKKNNALVGLTFVIVIIVVITGTTIFETKGKGSANQAVEGISTPSQSSNSSNPKTPTTAASSNGTPSPSTASSSSSVYKDGIYSADGSYMTHVGQESIGVKVTLKNDIITDVSVTEEAQDPESQEYQDTFAANYKQMVIGKDISSVHLDKVSTSSLTPIGFDSALQNIESQSKS